MDLKEKLILFLVKESSLNEKEVSNLISVPPNPKMGDFAFPCFKLSNKKVNPKEAAEKLKKKLESKLPEYISKMGIVGPYLNFYLNQEFVAKKVLKEVLKTGDKYGDQTIGKNKTIVLDFSAPNIAKPFSIGHLRSTVIGNSLYKVYKKLGYKTIGVNHLGDWGTQFGKMIVAYDLWGNKKDLKKDPIKYLLKLYVKFHTEAEKDEKLIEKGREAFKKLEEGKKHETKLWKEFKDLSLEEFKRMYALLAVKFDSWNGEAFYSNKIEKTIKKLQEKIETPISEGATIIDLEKFNMPAVLLKKTNGATTYHTRDLATAFYRLDKYKAGKILYVVGSPQSLHFKQLFKVMELYGENVNKFEHVRFGIIKFADGKMSTRKGKVIFLEDVLNKAIDLAKKAIGEKNPDLKNQEKVAKQIGIGAVIYADLSHDRVRDIDFDWDRMLSFEGNTGPYIQYTHARACSILRKAGIKSSSNFSGKIDYLVLKEENELITEIAKFKEVIREVTKNNKPHILANYLHKIAQIFNEFYHKKQVICEDKKVMKARLLLVDCSRQVLKNGLSLLGIDAPKEM